MGEHDFFSAVVQQVPALAVLVFLTLKFLAHLAAYQTTENSRTERMAEALEKNTEVLGRVAECLSQSARALDDNNRRRPT